MKGVLVILSGLGDLPCKQLGEKTPLEVAKMPNLGFLSARGELGFMHSVKPGFIPELDEAIVSIFGNNLLSSTLGQLEAKGADLKLTRGDLALRVNFATIDNETNGNIIDRRSGRTLTNSEAEILTRAINSKIKLSVNFEFVPTIQHRGVLVFRGGFSDNVTGNDSIYFHGRSREVNKISTCKAMDDDENSQYTANVLNEFLNQAHGILNNHPVNEERRKKGLMPANYLLIRGAGIETPKLKFYKKWASVSYMPLERGFSKLSGMKVFSFDYPKLTGLDSYKNFYEGLEKACKFSIKTIKKNKNTSDYIYIHIRETDLPGHDNKPHERVAMLEYIDKTLFKFLRKFAPPNKIKVLVTSDHSTPCKLKSHSTEPVPVLLYNDSKPKEKIFCEKEARKGTLGGIVGGGLLKKVGFTK
ncbi:MAG: alkaline phosphatase family protein [Candidatus Pacearchaeota archaeon]|jgi:2,3-bisphosphoglycerate-independent phosphoglycerate mutase